MKRRRIGSPQGGAERAVAGTARGAAATGGAAHATQETPDTAGGGIDVSALCLGAMPLGTATDEATSFAILDRFVAAGGSLIDTANNYCFWVEGRTGDESETTVGRWLASRDARDQVQLATKAGARPVAPGAGASRGLVGKAAEGVLARSEGLSAPVLRDALAGSLRRLGTDQVDLFYAHVEDRSVPVEETAAVLDELVRAGDTRLIGCSNHATWRVERARATADAHGWARYTCVQQRWSYLQPRPGVTLPQTAHVHATAELLDYVRSEPDLTLFAYSTLLEGGYTRADKPLSEPYRHPGTDRRLAALGEVAAETGATANQVVLAWLMGGTPAVVPIVGVTSVAQLDEALEATDLTLSQEQRERLDSAG